MTEIRSQVRGRVAQRIEVAFLLTAPYEGFLLRQNSDLRGKQWEDINNRWNWPF
jgi:hypothetical protein